MIVHDKTSIGDGLTEESTALRELTEDELDAVSGGGEDGPPGGEGGGPSGGDEGGAGPPEEP